MTTCTVLILTYKGKHHLEYLLPTVREAISNSPNYNIDVLIVDNGKDLPTKEFVNTFYSDYRFEFSEANDFLFSLNPFIQQFDSQYFFLLNDDTRVDSDIFNQSIPFLERDNSLFAVTAKIMNWDGVGCQNGVRKFEITKGWIQNYWFFLPENDATLYYTLYPSGGAALYRTNMVKQLGGFDPIFRPAYIEEVDLGYRSWVKNWKTIYNPNCYIFHKDAATMNEVFKSDEVSRFYYRNLFTWYYKSFKSTKFKTEFFIYLLYRFPQWCLNNRNMAFGFLRSLSNIKLFFHKKQKGILNEYEIEKIIGKVYEF